MTPWLLLLNDVIGKLSVLGMTLVGAHYIWSTYLYFRVAHGKPGPLAEIAKQRIAPEDCPQVLLQIPVFNEPNAVEGALMSAVGLDWPRNKLTIQLLDDSNDETSEIAAALTEKLRREGHEVVHVRREHRGGFKAGAMAHGLTLSDAPYIAVADADFRLPPEWLHATLGPLMADPTAAFCQCRLDFTAARETFTSRIQQLAMDSHFVVEQAGRAWSDLPFQFNGTGGVWRRDAIEAAGGWDDATITEDLDLIIRVKTSGRHGLFLMDPAPTGEVPEDFSTWQVQQERWSSGTAQVLSRTFSHIIEADLPLRSRIALLSMLSPAVFFPSLAVGIITLIIGTVLREGDMFFYWIEITFVMATAFFAVIAITLPPYLRLKRGSIGRYFQLTLLAPFLYVRLALANALAVTRAGTGSESMREFKRTPKSGATDL